MSPSRLLSSFAVLCLAVGFAATVAAAPIALVNGNLLDVERRVVRERTTVLIDGTRVTAVGRTGTIKLPADAQVIDCTGKWIMPGLVDAHVHLFQSGGLYTRPDIIDLRSARPYNDERAWVQENAGDLLARHLTVGVTTVFDFGGPFANYAIRDRYNQATTSPTIFLTGPLISTWQPEALGTDDPPIIRVDDPEAARNLVRRQVPHRPDFIKIWYIVRPERPAKDTLPIVKATIEEAHGAGLKVAVHATQLETAKLALEAGADILVHGVEDAPVDDEFIKALLRRRAAYIPTLTVMDRYVEVLSGKFVPDSHDLAVTNPFAAGSLLDLKHLRGEAAERAAELATRVRPSPERASHRQRNLETLWKAGALVATGTDAGNIGTLHGSSYLDEIVEMRKAGLDTWDIVQASTINGAKALGKQSEFGSIAKGKIADVLILDRNPIESIENAQAIHRVVRRGTLIEPATLIDSSPAALAQRQLSAYNSRNIDAFLEPYAEDVKVYSFPDKLQYTGKDAMRKGYAELFAATPQLHCELVNRIVLGNTVIDHERLSGRSGGVFEAVAVYKISDGKITSVYFMR